MRRIAMLGALLVAACGLGAIMAGSALATTSVVWKHEGGPWESSSVETEIRVWTSSTSYIIIKQMTGQDLFYGGGEAVGIAAGNWNFTSTEMNGQPCTSKGATVGEIQLNPLQGKVGLLNAKTVGVQLEPATKGSMLAEFSCGESSVAIRGGLIGSVSPVNTPIAHGEAFTATYGEGKPAHQQYSKLKGGAKTVLQASIDKGKFLKTTFVGTDASTPAEGETQEFEIVKTKK